MRDKFHNANGTLTDYALACGYIEKKTLEGKTMTREDFEFIARVLKANLDLANGAAIARRFARELEAANPNFDKARFLKACGVPE